MLTHRIWVNNQAGAQHMSEDPWGLVAAPQLLSSEHHPQERVFYIQRRSSSQPPRIPLTLSTRPPQGLRPVGCWLWAALDLPGSTSSGGSLPLSLGGDVSRNGSIRIQSFLINVQIISQADLLGDQREDSLLRFSFAFLYPPLQIEGCPHPFTHPAQP